MNITEYKLSKLGIKWIVMAVIFNNFTFKNSCLCRVIQIAKISLNSIQVLYLIETQLKENCFIDNWGNQKSKISKIQSISYQRSKENHIGLSGQNHFASRLSSKTLPCQQYQLKVNKPSS